MSCLPFLILAALFLAVIIGIGLAQRSRRVGRQRWRRSILDVLMHRLGATYSPETPDRRAELRWTVHNRTAVLTLADDPDGHPFAVALTIDFRRRSPGALRIFPAKDASPLAALLGAKDIRIGDPDFDRRFVVESNPEGLALRVFSPERRGALVAAIGDLWKEGEIDGPGIQLGRQTLTLTGGGPAGDETAILALARAGELLTAALLDRAMPAELWIGDESAAIGQCLVCGTPMTAATVLCASCRTPHHEECWRYAGRCSTFGCGGRRFQKSGS